MRGLRGFKNLELIALSRSHVKLNKLDLETLCTPYVDLPLECDGLSRVLSYVLIQAKVPHRRVAGFVETCSRILPIHFWLEVEPYVIDYRLKLWFKGDDPERPDGVFLPSQYVRYSYVEREEFEPTSDIIFKVLTMHAVEI